jgi:O-antigen/teichoic acid export membrane protein
MSVARKVALNASALAAGRAAMAGIGIISVGITTRYVGLEAFGSFVTAQSLIVVVGTVTDIGLWSVAAREIAKRPHEADRIVASVLTIGLVLSVLAAGVGVGATLLLYSGADDELVRQAAFMLMATLPMTAPFGAASAWFFSQQRAYMAMLGSLAQSLVTVGGLGLAVALDWGFTGVVAAYVAAALTQGVVAVALAGKEVRLRPSLDFRHARQLLVWSLPLGGALVLHQLYWRIDVLLLSKLASGAEVALYGVAIKILEALLVLPGFILITLLPEFARLANDRRRFDAIAQKAFSVMQVGGLGVAVFLAAFAPEIVELAGGPEFSEAGAVLQIMTVVVLISFPAAVFENIFFAQNRQKYILYVAAAVLPVNVVLNLALIPLWGAEGSALAWALSEVCVLTTFLVLYRRYVGPAPRPHRGLRVLVAALAMGAVTLLKLLPGVSGASPALVLILGAITCPAVYVAALYGFKAMPSEVHTNVMVPLWTRLRPS